MTAFELRSFIKGNQKNYIKNTGSSVTNRNFV